MMLYAINRVELGDSAAALTAYKTFDVGEDMGSIMQFLLNFHVPKDIHFTEWHN